MTPNIVPIYEIADHNGQQQEAALAQERLELADRSEYNVQLERAAHLVQSDPVRATAFLDDVQHFPLQRRDFTWRYLKQLARPQPESTRIRRLDVGGQAVGIAFAPDGRKVAVGLMQPESLVRVYDVPSGRLRHTLTGHMGHVAFLGFAADSRTLYSCDALAVKVWDAATGRELPVRNQHPTAVTALVCSPDGGELVTLGEDHVLRFWNLQSGRQESSHEVAADDSGFTVAWTAEGVLLARLDRDGVRIVDAHSGKERFVVPRTGDTVHSLLITTDARLSIAHEENAVTTWRLDTGEMVADIPPQSFAVSRDNKTLAGVDQEGSVQFWDPWTGQVRATFPGHAGEGFLARFSPDGNRLLTTGLDKTVRVWEAVTDEPVHSPSAPRSLPFHPGG